MKLIEDSFGPINQVFSPFQPIRNYWPRPLTVLTLACLKLSRKEFERNIFITFIMLIIKVVRAGLMWMWGRGVPFELP